MTNSVYDTTEPTDHGRFRDGYHGRPSGEDLLSVEFRPTRDLLRECQHAAFRLEVRDSYGVPGESEPLQRFLNDEPFDLRGWFRDWSDLIGELGGRGVTVSRVRVVTVPLTDYHRWLLTLAELNTEAGEIIRYLPRHAAGEVPSDDFWLCDDERVGFTLADQDGRAVGGVAVTTNRRLVDYCREVRKRLWPLATPYAEYG